jgi:molybdopterin-guanine dinucleotide biosynthesis protein A
VPNSLPPLDAVILAGGKSERLNGIVPPYHKPFLVINGKSLIVSAVQSAIDAGAQKVVVVATGENAMPVTQLVGHYQQVRIVLSNGGPGKALLTGLEMCDNQRVLVLMSDNVHGPNDVNHVSSYRYAIGMRLVPWAESERFTRFDGQHWVEKPFPFSQNMEPPVPGAEIMVWCGPLVIQRQRGLDLLIGEEKIGPVLGRLAPTFELVETNSVDVGIPDVVTELTKE